MLSFAHVFFFLTHWIIKLFDVDDGQTMDIDKIHRHCINCIFKYELKKYFDCMLGPLEMAEGRGPLGNRHPAPRLLRPWGRWNI